jgi:hypothetical protein
VAAIRARNAIVSNKLIFLHVLKPQAVLVVFGSRTSRRVSPRALKQRMVMNIKIPGVRSQG